MEDFRGQVLLLDTGETEWDEHDFDDLSACILLPSFRQISSQHIQWYIQDNRGKIGVVEDVGLVSL
jgi:predicted phosphatase